MVTLTASCLMAGVLCTFPAPHESPPISHPYYPLRVGSEWTYRVSGGRIVVRAADSRMAGNASGFLLETSANNRFSTREVIGVNRDGVFRFEVNELKPVTPILLLKSN